jgi:hypothetical protein
MVMTLPFVMLLGTAEKNIWWTFNHDYQYGNLTASIAE